MNVEEQVKIEIQQLAEEHGLSPDLALHKYLNNAWMHFLPDDTSIPHTCARATRLFLAQRDFSWDPNLTYRELYEGLYGEDATDSFEMQNHSERFLSQNHFEFYDTLDRTVDAIGIGANNLKQFFELEANRRNLSGLTDIYREKVLPICISMIKQGYVAYDLNA